MHSHVQQRTLALRRPFKTSGWTLSSRDILLFSIHDTDRGSTGWGEAAPLPLFGTESYAVSCHALEDAAKVINGKWDFAGIEFPDIDAFFPSLRQAPAARFAVECALLDLQSRLQRVSIAETLGGVQSDRIAVNAVIGAVDALEAARAAAEAWEEGYRCVKLKVGAGSLDEDIETIRAVRMAVPPEMLLRLDANGAWDFERAEEAIREFSFYDIEYIEQPVPADEHDELTALTGLGIIPVAADESAQDLSQARLLLERQAVNLFVIKPMAAGGIRDCRRFSMEAAAGGCDVVFTSLIDSSIGRHAVAQLCASLPSTTRHHGLATGALFLDDTHRDQIDQGEFLLPSSSGLGIAPEGS